MTDVTWFWDDAHPATANAVVLLSQVPGGHYNRYSLAAATGVSVDDVLSDYTTLLEKYPDVWQRYLDDIAEERNGLS